MCCYSALSVASAAISIYSICQIFTTTKQVSATNAKVRLNSKTLEIHSALLVLNCIVVVCFTAAYLPSSRIFNIVFMVLTMADLLIQLFICYICVKLGASDSLNRFDCCLVEDGNGGRQIKFFLKKLLVCRMPLVSAVYTKKMKLTAGLLTTHSREMSYSGEIAAEASALPTQKSATKSWDNF